jgi:hypothetical protein
MRRRIESEIGRRPVLAGQAAAYLELTEDDLAEMRLRCEQATPGPWKSYIEGREEMSGSDFIMTGAEDIYLTGATKADQDFIAHARQDIPRFISEVQRLRKLLPK